jgi:hypothetical protein
METAQKTRQMTGFPMGSTMPLQVPLPPSLPLPPVQVPVMHVPPPVQSEFCRQATHCP